MYFGAAGMGFNGETERLHLGVCDEDFFSVTEMLGRIKCQGRQGNKWLKPFFFSNHATKTGIILSAGSF